MSPRGNLGEDAARGRRRRRATEKSFSRLRRSEFTYFFLGRSVRTARRRVADTAGLFGATAAIRPGCPGRVRGAGQGPAAGRLLRAARGPAVAARGRAPVRGAVLRTAGGQPGRGVLAGHGTRHVLRSRLRAARKMSAVRRLRRRRRRRRADAAAPTPGRRRQRTPSALRRRGPAGRHQSRLRDHAQGPGSALVVRAAAGSRGRTFNAPALPVRCRAFPPHDRVFPPPPLVFDIYSPPHTQSSFA